MPQQICDFECPYCGESLSIPVDVIEGQTQDFIYDCEICCRPIEIRVKFVKGQIETFSASSDSES